MEYRLEKEYAWGRPKTKIRAPTEERVFQIEKIVGCRCLLPVGAANLRFFFRKYVDELAVAALVFEKHHTRDHRVQAVVLGAFHIPARLVTRAALTNQNAAAGNQLAAKSLDSQPLPVGVTSVC